MNDDERETRWRQMQDANLLPRPGIRARIVARIGRWEQWKVLLFLSCVISVPAYLVSAVVVMLAWWRG